MKTRICDECGKTNPTDSWYCQECGASLSMDAIVEDSFEAVLSYKNEKETKNELLPPGLELHQDANQLTATFSWFSTTRLVVTIPGTLVSLLLAVASFWLLFDLMNERLISLASLLALIIALGFLIYAGYCSYQMIRIGLNTTTLSFSRDELKVTHRPLPAPGNHLLTHCGITELSIEDRKERTWGFLPVESVGLFDFYCEIYQLKAKFQNRNYFTLLESPDYEIIRRIKLGIESILG